MSEETQPEVDPVGAIPPANTMPAGTAKQEPPEAPIGVTVFKRTVQVSEAGGGRRFMEMPDDQQLDCHPDIMEAGNNDA